MRGVCPVTHFGISNFQPSGSSNTDEISHSDNVSVSQSVTYLVLFGFGQHFHTMRHDFSLPSFR